MQHVELETIKLTVEGKDLYFLPARRLSEDLALTIVVGPMLAAWFDGKKAKNTQKCQNVSTSWGGWLTLKDMGAEFGLMSMMLNTVLYLPKWQQTKGGVL